MDKFLLATNPMRSESTDLYIIHMLKPRAIIRCEKLDPLIERKPSAVDWIFIYPGRNGQEVWKLSYYFLETSEEMNSEAIGRMFQRAWRWLRSYMDSRASGPSEDQIND